LISKPHRQFDSSPPALSSFGEEREKIILWDVSQRLGLQEIIPLFFADGHFEFFHHGQHVFPDFALTSKPNGSIIGT